MSALYLLLTLSIIYDNSIPRFFLFSLALGEKFALADQEAAGRSSLIEALNVFNLVPCFLCTVLECILVCYNTIGYLEITLVEGRGSIRAILSCAFVTPHRNKFSFSFRPPDPIRLTISDINNDH